MDKALHPPYKSFADMRAHVGLTPKEVYVAIDLAVASLLVVDPHIEERNTLLAQVGAQLTHNNTEDRLDLVVYSRGASALRMLSQTSHVTASVTTAGHLAGHIESMYRECQRRTRLVRIPISRRVLIADELDFATLSRGSFKPEISVHTQLKFILERGPALGVHVIGGVGSPQSWLAHYNEAPVFKFLVHMPAEQIRKIAPSLPLLPDLGEFMGVLPHPSGHGWLVCQMPFMSVMDMTSILRRIPAKSSAKDPDANNEQTVEPDMIHSADDQPVI